MKAHLKEKLRRKERIKRLLLILPDIRKGNIKIDDLSTPEQHTLASMLGHSRAYTLEGQDLKLNEWLKENIMNVLDVTIKISLGDVDFNETDLTKYII